LALLATALWGDSFTVHNTGGFETSVVCCSGGLNVGESEANGFVFSGPSDFVCGDVVDCGFFVSTGPLVTYAANEWIFGPGGTVDESIARDFDKGGPPPGVACDPDPDGTLCFAPPGVNPTIGFSGNVMMTFAGGQFLISGPVDLSIGGWLPGMATQYSGAFAMTIGNCDFEQAISPSGDFKADCGGNASNAVVATTSDGHFSNSPESPSVILLATMLVGIAFVARKRVASEIPATHK
jgi:hypothetical protein